ncbi:hypothetical protein ACFQ38_12010 [Sporosarcina contaminans]|uniref:Uncharacterized protein n=1 Tax=Sporosarcina contaminans TaxID=633403 RepID=A0ABW3TYM9_9BACL
MNYFYTNVSGICKKEVERRVTDLINRGFEVYKRSEAMETKTIYKRTDSIGRSKRAFDRREDIKKFEVVMRRPNREKAKT